MKNFSKLFYNELNAVSGGSRYSYNAGKSLGSGLRVYLVMVGLYALSNM